jgi:hypothetical protein
VRGGVEREAATEIGIEGCSGAEAVAFRALVSSKRESCELAGDGVFSGGVTAGGRAESRRASARSKSRGSDGSGCRGGRYVDSGASIKSLGKNRDFSQ